MRGWILIPMLAARVAAFQGEARAETPPFETPASGRFHLFEPYGWQMEFSQSAERTGTVQCFDVTVHRDGLQSLEPVCTLESFGGALEDGSGVIFVGSHGDEGFVVIEVYEPSPQGLAERNRAYENYRDSGWAEGYILPTADSQGYGIAVTGFGILSRFNDRNSIIYLSACHSCTAAFGFTGAREILCYDGAESIPQVLEDAGLFWSAMNGDAGRAARAVGVAAGPLYSTLRHFSGPGSTVLSPAVYDLSLEDGALLETLVDGWVAFDTRMDTDVEPVLHLQGPVMAGDLAWVNDTCFVFQAAPYDTDQCSICVSGSMRSAGGRVLDGNRNPPGSVAQGPPGDPHCVSMYALPDDPAARWGALWAFETPAGVRVEWTTETERDSDHFDVLGLERGEWRRLARVSAHGGLHRQAFYSVDVPAGSGPFIVSEVDARGSACDSRPFPLQHEPPASRDLGRPLESSGPSARPPASWRGPACGRAPAPTDLRVDDWPHYVFYGPDSLLAEVQPVVDAWAGEGIRSAFHPSTTNDP